MKFRIIIFILIVILLSSILFLIFFTKSSDKTGTQNRTVKLSPTLEPTVVVTPLTVNKSEWKTYSSAKYHYQISYPPDWQLLDEPNVNGIEIQKIDIQGAGISLSVRVVDNPQKLTVENFAKAQAFSQSAGTKNLIGKTTIGPFTAYKLQSLPQGLLFDIYIPYKEDQVYNLFAGGSVDQIAKNNLSFYQNMITQMLDSFRSF